MRPARRKTTGEEEEGGGEEIIEAELPQDGADASSAQVVVQEDDANAYDPASLSSGALRGRRSFQTHRQSFIVLDTHPIVCSYHII